MSPEKTKAPDTTREQSKRTQQPYSTTCRTARKRPTSADTLVALARALHWARFQRGPATEALAPILPAGPAPAISWALPTREVA
jgi:hypothetical protein